MHHLMNVPAWQINARFRCLVAGPSGSGESTLLHLLAPSNASPDRVDRKARDRTADWNRLSAEIRKKRARCARQP